MFLEGCKRSLLPIWATISLVSLVSIQQAAAQSAEEDDEHIVSHQIGNLSIDGGITAILQSTSGIPANGDVTDLSYTFDLVLGAEIHPAGKIVVAFEAGNGSGVNEIDGTEYFLSVPNYDAFVTFQGGIVALSLSQAYYEGSFSNGRFGLQMGKLDVHSLYDENAYANDETDQFISGQFSRTPGTVFQELDSYYAPGLAVTVNPFDLLEIRLIGANGSGDGFENITHNAYGVVQVNVKPKLLGREGNYRFFVIFDARDYTDATNGGINKNNTGAGLSFDQEVAESIGLFARYDTQDDDIAENLVKSAISGGVSLSGGLWNRSDDVLGVGYGLLGVNDKAPAIAALADSGDEGHFELYYKIGFTDHFTVTPDLQVITAAGGDNNSDTITIPGVRAQMNF
jgi:hypothetical protein